MSAELLPALGKFFDAIHYDSWKDKYNRGRVLIGRDREPDLHLSTQSFHILHDAFVTAAIRAAKLKSLNIAEEGRNKILDKLIEEMSIEKQKQS